MYFIVNMFAEERYFNSINVVKEKSNPVNSTFTYMTSYWVHSIACVEDKMFLLKKKQLLEIAKMTVLVLFQPYVRCHKNVGCKFLN